MAVTETPALSLHDALPIFEKRMAELAAKDLPVKREVWQRDKAVEFFKSIGEHYKAEIIAAIPAGEDVSLYREGDRSEEHTSELQSLRHLVCRLLLEKKNT